MSYLSSSAISCAYRNPRRVLSILALIALSACGGGNDAVPVAPTTQVSLAGWPSISGLTIKSDGTLVNGTTPFIVKTSSKLTFEAGGVLIASIAPKSTVTLFDLLPQRNCASSAELGKLASFLLSLDSDQNASNGISIPTLPAQANTVNLFSLDEAALLAAEQNLVGRSVPTSDALLTVNSALDQESWTEATADRVSFINDMTVLQNYLDRVLTVLATTAADITGFAYLSNDQAASIPATLKSQGMSFDGTTPVFSWRYGLQRTDANYKATLTQALAFPSDIQAEYMANPAGPHFGHIGDIDIADGKLYAAIEDEDDSSQQAYIALYDAKTLQYTGEKHALPRAEHADGVPWVAVDAPRKLLYTVTWSTVAAQKLNVFDLNTFNLLRSVPLQISFDGKRVQGAKVYNGMLYASADTKDTVVATGLKRKRVYKVDPISGSVLEIMTYDEPNRTESEGIAFSPDGKMHLVVIAPYTTPIYGTTTNTKPFDGSYSIDGDDWNPSATLRQFTRDAAPLREKLCAML